MKHTHTHMLNKEELKQSFCGRMPFLLTTSRNHSLDLIFSITTKTPEQGRGVTPFTSDLRRQYPNLKPKAMKQHKITTIKITILTTGKPEGKVGCLHRRRLVGIDAAAGRVQRHQLYWRRRATGLR